MSSPDYTKVIGNRSASPQVPLPFAIAVLAISGTALWFGIAQIPSKPSAREVADEIPAARGKPITQVHSMQR